MDRVLIVARSKSPVAPRLGLLEGTELCGSSRLLLDGRILLLHLNDFFLHLFFDVGRRLLCLCHLPFRSRWLCLLCALLLDLSVLLRLRWLRLQLRFPRDLALEHCNRLLQPSVASVDVERRLVRLEAVLEPPQALQSCSKPAVSPCPQRHELDALLRILESLVKGPHLGVRRAPVAHEQMAVALLGQPERVEVDGVIVLAA
mmetsp:Transcript_20978/g.51520  ORF Transcript_20978/g.51520 Transcript_20978/m.51520 type:complete len:202 (+) Transcript_20978:1680-2285(+)